MLHCDFIVIANFFSPKAAYIIKHFCKQAKLLLPGIIWAFYKTEHISTAWVDLSLIETCVPSPFLEESLVYKF